jgi:hypothetical protein
VKKVFLILACVLVWGCSEKQEPKPANLLSEKKLTAILIDMHIAEARVEARGFSIDTATALYDNLKQDIYKKHKVSEDRFQKSYNYYLVNLKKLDKIYENVIDSLSMREVKATSK